MKIIKMVVTHNIKVFDIGEEVRATSTRTGYYIGQIMKVSRHIPGDPGYDNDAGVLFFEEETYQGNKQTGHSDEYWTPVD